MVWDTVKRWAGDVFGGGSSLPSSAYDLPQNVGSTTWTSAVNAPNQGFGSFSGGSFPSDVGNIPWTTAINAPNSGYSGFNWQDALGAAQGIINTTNPSNQGGSGSQRINNASQPSSQALMGNSNSGANIGDGYVDFGNRNAIVLPNLYGGSTRMADVGSASGGGKNKLLGAAMGAATGYAKGGIPGAIIGGLGGLFG